MHKKLTSLKQGLNSFNPISENSQPTASSPPKKKGAKRGHGPSFNFLALAKKWPEIVGPYLGNKSLPIKLKGGVLTLIVKHQTYAQELRFSEKMIIKKVTEHFPIFCRDIQKINFMVKDNFSLDDYSFHTLINTDGEMNSKTKHKIHPQSPLYRELQSKATLLFQEVLDEEIKILLTEIFFHHHTPIEKD